MYQVKVKFDIQGMDEFSIKAQVELSKLLNNNLFSWERQLKIDNLKYEHVTYCEDTARGLPRVKTVEFTVWADIPNNVILNWKKWLDNAGYKLNSYCFVSWMVYNPDFELDFEVVRRLSDIR